MTTLATAGSGLLTTVWVTAIIVLSNVVIFILVSRLAIEPSNPMPHPNPHPHPKPKRKPNPHPHP